MAAFAGWGIEFYANFQSLRGKLQVNRFRTGIRPFPGREMYFNLLFEVISKL